METNQHIPHIPVMLTEILDYLRPSRHGVILVDCTLGYGGHSQALCEQFNETDLLIGLDKDEQAIESCRETFRYVEYPVRLVHQGFENVALLFEENDLEEADYYLFDCGFSSVQVDLAERGFSFMRDGALDMRMDQRQPLSAKEIVASWSEEQLANAFKQYGDERFSRRIAKAITRRRKSHAINTTQELADIVTDAIPAKYKHQEGIHPATRVFQALRIVVNDELEALRRGLQAALDHLRPGGRIGVLSYHSLEHRIVKELFRSYCGRCICPPGLPQCGCGAKAMGTIITRRPVKPCAAETDRNPRARSAQLRVLERFGIENE